MTAVDRAPATDPSPAEAAEIARFGMFDREQRMADLAADINTAVPAALAKQQRREEERCRSVLHIDWDADPAPMREDIAQCVLAAGHDGRRHQGKDAGGSWFRW